MAKIEAATTVIRPATAMERLADGPLDFAHGQCAGSSHSMAGGADGDALGHRLMDPEQLADMGREDISDHTGDNQHADSQRCHTAQLL